MRLRVRALLRRSLGATVFLSVLVGVAGALVLTGVIGARRASSTYDELLARNRPPDAVAVFCEATCATGGRRGPHALRDAGGPGLPRLAPRRDGHE